MLGGSAFYDIGPFRLDLSTRLLSLEGQALPLGPRAVAVLSVLVEAAGQPQTKERILEAAWPGLVVEEANLAVQISAIRKTLSRAGGAEHWIETLPRRGYRFAGPVLMGSAPKDAGGDAAGGALDARSPVDRRAAVCQHERRSEPGLFRRRRRRGNHHGAQPHPLVVRHRPHLQLQLQGQGSTGFKQIARELGVRYIVEGSIRRSADQLRITAQLIDAATGAHLWADQLRRVDPRRVRAAGPACTGGGRRHRAGAHRSRDPACAAGAHAGHHGLRAVPARPPRRLFLGENRHPGGDRPLESGDRARPSLRPGAGSAVGLPYVPVCRRLVRRLRRAIQPNGRARAANDSLRPR